MLTRKKCRLLLTGLLLCLLLLPGCGGPAPTKSTPASFTADLTVAAESGDEKALSAYKGNTCQLNAKVENVLPDGYITVRCTDSVRIRLSIPQEELQGLKMGDVLALEGAVNEVEIKQYGGMSNVTMTMDPAHVTGNVFAITGEVEKIYHDWDRDGQDYAAMVDNSVVQGRQVNIYLPEGHGLREGDSLSAKGTLTAPGDYAGGLLAASEKGGPEVFVMYEPEALQKGEPS